MDHTLLAILALIAVALIVRFHQWLPRRGEFHRHGCLDAGIDSGESGHLGGILQFRGRVRIRDRRRTDSRRRYGRPERRDAYGDLRRA